AVAAPGRGGLGGRLTAAGGLALAALGTHGRAGVAVGGRRRVGQGRGALGLLETDDLRATAERGRRGTVARTRGGVPGGGGERRTRGAVGRHRPGPHTSTAGLGARRLRRRRASRGGGVRGRRRGTGGRGGAVAGRPVPRRGAEAGAGRGLRGGVGGHPALPGGLARLLGLHLEVEQVAHRLLLDGLVHGLEELVALTLVLDERVALPHGAQPDALLEVVHLVEVLAPLAVEHGEHDAPLELTHDVGGQLLLAALVGEVDV